jgi:hypothetical protein
MRYEEGGVQGDERGVGARGEGERREGISFSFSFPHLDISLIFLSYRS